MKGIHIKVRAGVYDQGLLEFELAGTDRKKVIEACVGRLPESLRVKLRKQLGLAIEVDNVALNASAQSSDGSAIATLHPCEVIS